MKAWQVHDWCEPEGMKLSNVAVPEPGPLQVRIRNHVVWLNFFDLLQIQGKYQVRPAFPFVPGALQPGETLLVHAGASGVGMSAILMGKALGANVIATAGEPERLSSRLAREPSMRSITAIHRGWAATFSTSQPGASPPKAGCWSSGLPAAASRTFR